MTDMMKQLSRKTSTKTRCIGITTLGNQCRLQAQKGRLFCRNHRDQIDNYTIKLTAENLSKSTALADAQGEI